MSRSAVTWARVGGVRGDQGEGGEQGAEGCASMFSLLENEPGVFVIAKEATSNCWIYIHIAYPLTRIPNSSVTFFSVRHKKAGLQHLGNRESYHKTAGGKTAGKKSEIRNQKNAAQIY